MRSNEQSHAQQMVILARAYPGRTLLALLLAAAGLYVLATHIIPSEKADVRAAIEQVRDGIIEGDADKVLDRVSPDFYEERIDKPALAAWLRSVLARQHVDHLTIVLRQLEFSDGTAVATVSVRSMRSRRYPPTDWSVELEKANGRWLVRRAVPTLVAGYPAMGFRELLRVY